MITASRRHALLVPWLPLAGPAPQLVEHVGDLIISVPDGHLAEDLEIVERCALAPRSHWLLHLELRVCPALPVDHEAKHLRLVVQVHEDLLDRRSEDPLLQFHRTGLT